MTTEYMSGWLDGQYDLTADRRTRQVCLHRASPDYRRGYLDGYRKQAQA